MVFKGNSGSTEGGAKVKPLWISPDGYGHKFLISDMHAHAGEGNPTKISLGSTAQAITVARKAAVNGVEMKFTGTYHSSHEREVLKQLQIYLKSITNATGGGGGYIHIYV